jgi:hypothetical protein
MAQQPHTAAPCLSSSSGECPGDACGLADSSHFSAGCATAGQTQLHNECRGSAALAGQSWNPSLLHHMPDVLACDCVENMTKAFPLHASRSVPYPPTVNDASMADLVRCGGCSRSVYKAGAGDRGLPIYIVCPSRLQPSSAVLLRLCVLPSYNPTVPLPALKSI